MILLANIDISEIKDAKGRIELSGQIDPEKKQVALLLSDAKLLVKKPVAFRMKLEGMGYGRIELSGWLQTEVSLQCSRCLEWFDYPLEENFMVDYHPAISKPVAREKDDEHHGSVEITEDDIYINYYTGNTLNILEEYCAQLILLLPMVPRCSEGCKGFCSQCGQNLNVKECSCMPARVFEKEGKLSIELKAMEAISS
ncbi:DUF177 domain-containing protein [Candidatus Desantisbacteria bacterium]|nr:DUF177 domain-containing protein [Candidatus Desantisbacteria bacterium]